MEQGKMRASDAGAAGVFTAFLRLGLTSFGGPVAHLGYFRTEFVTRRRWLDEHAFGDLVGLCQFLPGPASSQVGFAIGLMRAGYPGALAAWAGFTLPSALAMLLFALGVGQLDATAAGAGALHGLKLVAVAIVAQAVWGMARSLCPDRPRAAIGGLAAVAALLLPGALVQLGVILAGALAGIAACRNGDGALRPPVAMPVSRTAGLVFLAAFAALLGVALTGHGLLAAFLRAGALVFGGGHVVLPLLRDGIVGPGWVGDGAFLAGYGAAQAMPGPLFTFAAYLGAMATPDRLIGAGIGLAGIFVPGLLLLLGVLPFWQALRGRPVAQAAMRGVNAAVVGLLAAALYNPVFTSSVLSPLHAALALAGFVLLVPWRAPPILVVALGAALGAALL